MSGQAEQLQQTMAFFKLEGAATARPAGRSAKPGLAASRPSPAKATGNGKLPASLAHAAGVAVDEAHFTRF